MNVHFQEDDLGVLVAQHVESWSYSDARLAPEAESVENKLLQNQRASETTGSDTVNSLFCRAKRLDVSLHT